MLRAKVLLLVPWVVVFLADPLRAQAPYRVRDINPSAQPLFGWNPSKVVAAGGRLFFSATDEVYGRELWTSDGTPGGTHLAKDIYQGLSSSNPFPLAAAGDLGFFTLPGQRQLWRSDGTPSGTFHLRTFSLLGSAVGIGSTLFFLADAQLWKSDGTPSGTVLVRDLGGSGNPTEFTAVGGRLFFSYGELWRSDGTFDGTAMVKDIAPGPPGSFPHDIVDAGETIFFAANDGTSGSELWKSDGTEAGTVRVRDIQPGPSGSLNYPWRALFMDGILFFTATTPAYGYELWRSDGTEDGTYLLSDVRPGPEGSSPTDYAGMNGVMYFVAKRSPAEAELFQSDGTESGTLRVADVLGVPTGSNPDYLTVVGGTLFYSADFSGGTELGRTDGTPVGTWATDLNPRGSSYPRSLTAVGNSLWFGAEDGTGGPDDTKGVKLWRAQDSNVVLIPLPVNRPPVANAGPDFQVVANTPFTLDGSASQDPDGDALRYEWRDARGNVFGSDAVITMPGLGARTTRLPYDFFVVVSDGALSSTDSVRVTVVPAGKAPVRK